MSDPSLGDLKPVYLIFGDEGLLLERAVRRLRERLSKVADLDFNFDSFDGETADADTIVSAANTLPFMSERRLVVVHDVDRMPPAGLATLADYAADPAEHTCLVLVARKIARNSRLFKAVDARKGAFEYKAPRRSEYPGHVEEMFRDRGKTVSREAAEMLVDAVGWDLRRLESEVEKIASFSGERAKLDREDIAAVMSRVAPVSVFDLTDALGNRDCAGALRSLGELLAQGESVHGAEAMAVRHVRSLLAVRSLLDRGLRGGAGRELGLPDWQLRKLVGQAGRYEARELVSALKGAAATESDMKTGRTDPRLALERWLVALCAR